MLTKSGISNEDEFVEKVNGKKYGELNNNLQYFIAHLFPYVSDDDMLYCFKTEDYIKPDICIKWKDKEEFISLKFGMSDGIHGESLLTFLDFLKSLGLEQEYIKTIQLFAYGDGTTDGTGEVRKNGIEVRYELKDEIFKLNKRLNQDKDFIKKVIERLLFKGVNPLAQKARYIYHGNTEYGDFVSSSQIMKHIDNKSWAFMDCPHIGPVVFRPHARYSQKTIRNEKYRHELKFSWPNLLPDMRYMNRRYNW
ncbi:MAG: hypothetical protein MJ248_03115 [Bacilli bacterium]|nr:hypothetical protein [Bacilli bacterium]